MSANRRTTSKEFNELLEILKSTRMAGDAPFARFMDRDTEGDSGPARHTASSEMEE
jgi:hypothetical protein